MSGRSFVSEKGSLDGHVRVSQSGMSRAKLYFEANARDELWPSVTISTFDGIDTLQSHE